MCTRVDVIGVAHARGGNQLLALGLNCSLCLTLGLWVFKNWQANDYLVLVSKARRNALLPNLTVAQIRKDSGVLVCY